MADSSLSGRVAKGREQARGGRKIGKERKRGCPLFNDTEILGERRGTVLPSLKADGSSSSKTLGWDHKPCSAPNTHHFCYSVNTSFCLREAGGTRAGWERGEGQQRCHQCKIKIIIKNHLECEFVSVTQWKEFGAFGFILFLSHNGQHGTRVVEVCRCGLLSGTRIGKCCSDVEACQVQF